MTSNRTPSPAVVEETPQLTPLVSAQVVYEAASRFLAVSRQGSEAASRFLGGSMLGREYSAALTALREAVARADAAIEASKPFMVDGQQHLEPPDDIDLEDITIHDECAVHAGECGVWYQAWVYVRKPGQEG